MLLWGTCPAAAIILPYLSTFHPLSCAQVIPPCATPPLTFLQEGEMLCSIGTCVKRDFTESYSEEGGRKGKGRS